MRLSSILLLLLCSTLQAQTLPGLVVSENQRYLETEHGEPFFWLGDTAWELIHRLNKEEIEIYLNDRAEKGFNVIQTVILAELDGLNTPNAYGHTPLIDNNPELINEDYFELVDFVVQKAGNLGLYVALLPTWGDKFNKRWGAGPEIFTPENAKIYGEILSRRYQDASNIIWVLGGDRIPENDHHFEIIRAMAEGIQSADPKKLITYHPSGAQVSTGFFNEPWLDLDMFQSGHSRQAREFNYVLRALNTHPKRPVINGEARYENIRDRFWEETDYGWLDDADARVSAYWTMLAGAAGYTYGANDIWQMYDADHTPVIEARTGWREALHFQGAKHMGYMRSFFEKFEWQDLRYSPDLIEAQNVEDHSYLVAAFSKDSQIVCTYTPTGKPIKTDLSIFDNEIVNAYWFNPRNGTLVFIGKKETQEVHTFTPWATGWGSDFLLVISKNELTH